MILDVGYKLILNSEGNLNEGIGILIKKKLVKRIRQMKRINDHISLIELILKG